MKCPKCQVDNREDAEFCGDCGITLQVVCPNCGRSNPTSKKFCDKCSQSRIEFKETPPIDYSEPQGNTPKFLAEKVEKILDTRSSIEGERKMVTVLFADVANYTSISEKLDPEEVHQIMHGCYSVLMNEIHGYEGTIEKFSGDRVMALFGAPIAYEDHPKRACHAALAIQSALGEYSKKIKKEYGIEFKMRVGLNTGYVIIGSVRNDLRVDFTALGDTTNIASRIESIANPGTVLVSAGTYKLVRDFFKFDPMGKVELKGKDEPIEIYQLKETGMVDTRFAAAVVKGLRRFIGRENEIAALREAFEKAKLGHGQVVGIGGEAGIGKSRLLLELIRVLPQGDYTYLEGCCHHYGNSITYLPFLDILRSYFNIREGKHESIITKTIENRVINLDKNFEDILPPIYDILSLKVRNQDYLKLQPHIRRQKIFNAILDLLVQESQNRTVIIAIEDLQWIDRTSEEFLDYLISSLSDAHILLVLLYRQEYIHQWSNKSYYCGIHLDQLSSSNSNKLVQSILEDRDVTSELDDLIQSMTEGNPLFIEELTHDFLENGSIQKKDHQYVLSIDAADIQVPDTIYGIIADRIDRLEEKLRQILQIASVIGRDFNLRVLQNITGMREELKSHLINLQGLEFIYEVSLFPELDYIFKHALTQEVAYNSLLRRRREELHERAGKTIEELYPERLTEFYEILAYHYSRSNNAERAYQYLKLSGYKSVCSYSNWEAFRFYRDAIRILTKEPGNEENIKRQIEVRLLMDAPMRLLAYPEDSLEILQEGERLARELGDQSSLACFYSYIGLYHSVRGHPLKWIAYAKNAFQEAMKMKSVDLAAPLAFDLCSSYAMVGEYLEITAIVPQVIALLEETQRECDNFEKGLNIYSQLLGHCGLAHAFQGNFLEAESLCGESIRFAREIDDSWSIGFSEVMDGLHLIAKGDGLNSIKHMKKAIRYIEDKQIIPALGLTYSALGWGFYFIKELNTAKKHFEKGITTQKNAGLTFLLSMHYLGLGMVHFDLGDLKKAQSNVKEALQSAQDQNEKWVEGLSKITLGHIIGKRDKSQSVKAEEYILGGIKALEELNLKPFYSRGYLYLGELYSSIGRREKALQHLKKSEAAFKNMEMDYWLCKTQEALERLQL